MGARAANLTLACWLFLSAFLWHHTRSEFIDATVVSIFIVVFTPATARAGWPWYVTAGLGGWLMVSAPLLRRLSVATYWNHAIVGLGLVMVATVRLLHDRRGQEARDQRLT